MSTRSRVGVLNEDDTIRSIYVHSDGYPSYMGVLLQAHYRSITKIIKMIGLGDCSVLQEHLGEKHNFDERNGVYGTPSYGAPDTPMQKGWSCFYGRDRGQAKDEISAEEHKSIQEFVAYADQTDAEWIYLFKSGEWLCAEMPARDDDKVEFVSIEDALLIEEGIYGKVINA